MIGAAKLSASAKVIVMWMRLSAGNKYEVGSRSKTSSIGFPSSLVRMSGYSRAQLIAF